MLLKSTPNCSWIHDANGNVIGMVTGSNERRFFSLATCDANGVPRNFTGLVAPIARRAPTITNLNGLKRWRAALGDYQYGLPTIYCVGDSGTYGIGSGGTGSEDDATGDSKGYVGQLRTMFATDLGKTASGTMHAIDGRVTATTTLSSGGSAGLGGTAILISSFSTLTFPLPSCTGFDILYVENDGTDGDSVITAGWKYRVDGGAYTNVATLNATTGAVQQYKSVSVTGLSQATHTIDLVGLSSTNIAAICGIRYHSTSGVCVGRFGMSGYTIVDLLGTGTSGALNVQASYGQSRLLKAFTMGSPDLVIIPLGNNECVNQSTAGWLTKPALFKTALQSVITQVTAAGGCVLLVSEPRPNVAAGGASDFSEYWEIQRQLAVANTHCAHISFPEIWGTYAQANSLSMTYDTLHPSRRGYGDIARILHHVLTQRIPTE